MIDWIHWVWIDSVNCLQLDIKLICICIVSHLFTSILWTGTSVNRGIRMFDWWIFIGERKARKYGGF